MWISVWTKYVLCLFFLNNNTFYVVSQKKKKTMFHVFLCLSVIFVFECDVSVVICGFHKV